MNLLNLPLVSWINGTIMIGVFVAVFLLMNSDTAKK